MATSGTPNGALKSHVSTEVKVIMQNSDGQKTESAVASTSAVSKVSLSDMASMEKNESVSTPESTPVSKPNASRKPFDVAEAQNKLNLVYASMAEFAAAGGRVEHTTITRRTKSGAIRAAVAVVYAVPPPYDIVAIETAEGVKFVIEANE